MRVSGRVLTFTLVDTCAMGKPAELERVGNPARMGKTSLVLTALN